MELENFIALYAKIDISMFLNKNNNTNILIAIRNSNARVGRAGGSK